MMLHTDLELFYDIIHNGDFNNGETFCTVPNSSLDLPVCERYSSYNVAEIYAQVCSKKPTIKLQRISYLVDSISE